MPQAARCYVEISRSRIAANYRAVRDAVAPGTQIMGVVKAERLWARRGGSCACAVRGRREWLAVSSVEEGIALRRAGIDCRILVMAGVMPWEHEALREFRLTPVAHSLDDLSARSMIRDDAGAARSRRSPENRYGMNRLGTRAAAAEIADGGLGAAPCAAWKACCRISHPRPISPRTQTEEQIRAFDEMWPALASLGVRPALMHFASTNAIAYPRRDAWLSLVRPGHAIYGYVSPARGHAPPPVLAVKPALSWQARIVAREGSAGGREDRLRRLVRSRSADADGGSRGRLCRWRSAPAFEQRQSDRGRPFRADRRHGSMDLTTIDITRLAAA